MPNLVNPISSRLGVSRFWNSTWALSSHSNYGYVSVASQQNSLYIDKLISVTVERLNKAGLTPVSYKSVSVNSTLYLIFYVKLYKLITFKRGIQQIVKRKKFVRRVLKSHKYFVRNTSRAFFKAKYKPLSQPLAQYKQLPKFFITNTLLGFYDYFLKFSLETKKIAWRMHSRSNYGYNFVGELSVELLKMLLVRRLLGSLRMFILSSLKKLFFSSTVVLKALLIILPPTALTAGFISQYVLARLKNRFPVRKLVKTLVSQMRKAQQHAQILGFKIVCSGRFERRGRASYVWDNTGKVGNATTTVDIDYSLSLVTLINSMCAVKIWITSVKQPPKILII